MYDVMIDLETTGTKFHAGILTIGAVKYDMETGAVVDKFYARLGYTCAALFGTVDADTLAWWDRQDTAVKHEEFTGGDDVYESAAGLSEFCKGAKGVWGNGATFDISILDHWYYQLGLSPAWNYNVCDCRTLERAANRIGLLRKSFVRDGSHHNALDDALYQVRYISAMWQQLTNVNDNHMLRARFETLFAQAPYEFNMLRHPSDSPSWPGNYVEYHVQCAWLGFCRGLAV